MTTARISALKERHSRLEQDLADALARPFVDEVEIADIKKRKLAIKDEIAALAEPREVAEAV